jgi:hypothetical protein
MSLVTCYLTISFISNYVTNGMWVMSGIKIKDNENCVLQLSTITFVIRIPDSVKTNLFRTPY